MERNQRATRELTARERQQAVSALLARAHDGKPRRGAIKEVAGNFSVHEKTISRLWKRAKTNAAQHGVYEATTLKHLTGRRPRDLKAVLERLRHVDVQQRTTIRSAAVACGVPATTLFRRLKQGKLRSCTSVTRPLLTPANLQARIKFCLDHVDTSTNKYRDMMDVIHVDEKYFFLTVVKRRFIMLHDEPDPIRKLKSKRHITKEMLAAVARPRYNEAGECIFDGKLGTWPFVVHTLAERTSRNRPAGTPLVKAVTATKENYREMLIDKLLPAIRSKWPGGGRGTGITIQQDNASPHIDTKDSAFCAAVDALDLNVVLKFQPPNSPDLNCLDLGAFHAIQARQQLRSPRTLAELVAATIEAYWELPDETLNNIFLSLQCAMESCIREQGENTYKLTHMAKAKLRREGRLPLTIAYSDYTVSVIRVLATITSSTHS
ncbi:hypothetical protein PF003_g19167 [Phytophthora fragariae]|nr:hypothetical protein PF003_g19167 [Phytophthora fragariae]